VEVLAQAAEVVVQMAGLAVLVAVQNKAAQVVLATPLQ
jgi:hypothetical protein